MSAGRYINPEEQSKLLAELRSPRDRLLVVLALNTGFRISELLSLRWRQLVDASNTPLPFVEVPRRNLKGGRSLRKKRIANRRLPINAAAAATIREHAFSLGANLSHEGWVFASRKKFPGVLSRRQAHEIISDAAHRAGLSGPIGPHSCRRAFSVGAWILTKDLLLVQNLMGHADPLTTAVYLRWGREDELNSVVIKLGGGDAFPLGAGMPTQTSTAPAAVAMAT